MKHPIFCALFFCFLSGMVSAQSVQELAPLPDFRFETGDMLFQDVDCGPLCDAIEAVTQGVEGRSFSHAGLVYRNHDSVFVIEASGNDVHLTPLYVFLHRSKDSKGRPKVFVGRLKKAYRWLNGEAVAFALRQDGMPYDHAFIYDNGAYYCSELIYDAYQYARGGKPFFSLEPMTFRDPATGTSFPAWVQYYGALNTDIPEGKPGCNPGGISRSRKLEIVMRFY